MVHQPISVPLLDYLSRHFLELNQVLTQSAVTLDWLRSQQSDEVVPQASYHITMAVKSQSYFGEHNESHALEYFPLSIVDWIAAVRKVEAHCRQEVDRGVIVSRMYEQFSQRYCQQLQRLSELGARVNSEKYSSVSIKAEWLSFLDGTYGLCTSGKPEDIALKEVAIEQISRELEDPEQLDLTQLKIAVDWLDVSAAQFAPHEYELSSRYQFVDQVKKQYFE